MYQEKARHPLSAQAAPLDEDTRQAMWSLFVQIGRFWRNVDDPTPYQSRLFSFMLNRIGLDPLYREYYSTAREVIAQLIQDMGPEQAYTYLFTDTTANQAPPTTKLALTRQKVSNEFIALQLSLGGFKAFGAINYPGYICGGNIPGQPVPYRTFEEDT